MSDTLLKWVAEELLGFSCVPEVKYMTPQEYHHPYFGYVTLSWFESWNGIGLVVAEMERRGQADEKLLIRFRWRLEETDLESTPWWHLPIPEKWHHVFAAARKAVEGTEG